VAHRDVGEGTRLAAATGAWIVFEDEAGQALRPPKARTSARRGHTHVVAVSGKGSGRVSAAGLVWVCLKPGMRSRLFYQVRVHRGRKSGLAYLTIVRTTHFRIKVLQKHEQINCSQRVY
jgi:hypothetical protein